MQKKNLKKKMNVNISNIYIFKEEIIYDITYLAQVLKSDLIFLPFSKS